MNPLVGRWTPRYRQIDFNESKMLKLKPNDVSDLIILADGTGWSERKRSFGRVEKRELVWEDFGDGWYGIVIPYARTGLTCTIRNGVLVSVWDTPLKSLTNMGVYFEKIDI